MLNAINRQDLNAWATGLAAAINIALNLAFIPRYGYLAARTTTVVTEAALCVFGRWFVHPEEESRAAPAGHRVDLPARAIVYLVAIFLLRAVDADVWRAGCSGRVRRDGSVTSARPGPLWMGNRKIYGPLNHVSERTREDQNQGGPQPSSPDPRRLVADRAEDAARRPHARAGRCARRAPGDRLRG